MEKVQKRPSRDRGRKGTSADQVRPLCGRAQKRTRKQCSRSPPPPPPSPFPSPSSLNSPAAGQSPSLPSLPLPHPLRASVRALPLSPTLSLVSARTLSALSRESRRDADVAAACMQCLLSSSSLGK
eukprot:3314559-Rhodomonas_salina.4